VRSGPYHKAVHGQAEELAALPRVGEQHAVGVVLGGPGGDRPDCDVGARNVTEHVLY
jgi:hypothetical protein